MAFFEELKKNLSGVSDSVAKRSESVVKKSTDVLELQKAKLKKVSLENDLKNAYAELGKLYFENYADGDLPKEMAELCEKITACQHAINEAEQKAASLKGVVVCASCQAEVDKDASYCPKCGAEIIHVVEDEESDLEDDEIADEEETEAPEDAAEEATEKPVEAAEEPQVSADEEEQAEEE
jgi:ribosomal protein L40E